MMRWLPSAALAAAAVVLLLAVALTPAATAALSSPFCQPPDWSVPPLAPADADAELVQVQVLFRHGDRMIAGAQPCWNNDQTVWSCNLTYLSAPGDGMGSAAPLTPGPTRVYRRRFLPGRNYFRGDCELGQLTDIGLRQEVANGQRLAAAYVSPAAAPTSRLLPPALNQSLVWARSDLVDRTMQSAQALLYGLYPPASPSSQQQVVNIWTMDSALEDMSPSATLCPLLATLMAEAAASAAYRSYAAAVIAPLQQRFSALFNTTFAASLFAGGHVADCLTTRLCHNLTAALPAGFTQQMYLELMDVHLWVWNYTHAYPNRTVAAQAGIGFLVRDMLRVFDAAVNGSALPPIAAPSLLLYAGHDTSLIAFLTAFGVDLLSWPTYASALILELYYRPAPVDAYAVRMLYNGQPVAPLGCPAGGLCPYAAWSALAKTLYFENPAASCQA